MNRVFFLELMRTYQSHKAASRAAFAKLGLSEGQPRILYTLKRIDGCVQKELAYSCCISEATLTVMLKKLIEKNYVRKETVFINGGKRAYAIWLTDEGRKKADEIESFTDKIDLQCLSGFSEKEKEQLFNYFDRICDNLGKA